MGAPAAAAMCGLRTALCVVGAWALVACIEPGLVPCGDQLCPSGTTCVAGELCATTEQITACDGIDEGGACSVASGVGRCDRGVCVATGCGNQIVDVDEVCDDGNQTSGDGCRADCRKVEMCGDAIVDDGEGCDDGNANPADGCDACVPTAWSATAILGGNTNATSVELSSIQAVAVDLRGNIYIADTYGQLIRRVDTTGVITTIAGTGTAGTSGDGGPATSAQIDFPIAIAVDGIGNLYFTQDRDRVRRIDPQGVITTVAGTAVSGFSGDGGPATTAQLSFPGGLAVDGLGNLYIADSGNRRIRRVDTSGTITTVAGTGISGFSGDGGPATSAQLSLPLDVEADSAGRLNILDGGNLRIRRVDANGIITTFAGNGVAGFSGDGGPAIDASFYFGSFSDRGSLGVGTQGDVFITDSGNFRIRRIDSAGIVTTVAGTGVLGSTGDGGPATSAQLGPSDVAVDRTGNVFVADSYGHRIRRVDATGTISSYAGTAVASASGDGGPATCAELAYPRRIAVDAAGNIYIADSDDSRIRRVDPTGLITTFAGTGIAGDTGDGGPATNARLRYPTAVAVDAAGNVYINDADSARVRRVDTTGTITTVAGNGTWGFSGDGGPATSAQLVYPVAIAVDGAGTLYIADQGDHRIRRVAANGVITTFAGTGVDGSGGDGGPATSAELMDPVGLATDGAGNVYVADDAAYRVRRIDTNGVITTVAGIGTYGTTGDGGPATSAELYDPNAVVVDTAGNLYIAEANNYAIRKVDTAGIITTFAGEHLQLFKGDGGAAAQARFVYPTGLALDTAGNLYISDPDDNHVRRVSTSGTITTVAGLIDPIGMGPSSIARLSDPRALVVAAPLTLFAGGTFGNVQALRSAPDRLEVVAGRYPQPLATGAFARFRNRDFGMVVGIAYDAAARLMYLTESSSNRLHVVTLVDPADENTWTIAPLANASGTAGFVDGAAATAQFRNPTGLYLDSAAHQLYVADTGNHAIRAIDLASGVASATVRTVAGIPATRGFFGDGGAAASALLYEPKAITRCANGDLFIADTGNHRVRRVAASDTKISTVLGVGVAASSGEGKPASTFPVNTPLGLACDALGNLFVTSTTTVRLLPADASGIVDGSGAVQTIYGAPPRDTFPASVTTCLTGLAAVDATTVQVVDSCTGILVELRREIK